ncbi:hypothetical protein AADG42_12435 [Ammonicoccus fulvus]|uniref:DUF4386 family protein n=1 Tax=Ammonicoccus fulvus TaxID=3138240 RepID=A0ABZ3FU22_9ACTN
MTHPDNALAPSAIDRPATRRTGTALLLGTISLVAWPLALAVASLIDFTAPYSSVPGTDTGYFEAVAANQGVWAAASFVFLAAALFTLASVPAVWRLSVGKAPIWAWVAAVMGTLLAFGQIVHLMSWRVMIPGLADSDLSGEQALALMYGVDAQPFFMVIFMPFLIGFTLAPLAFAVALWRGRVAPVWSPILAGVAGVGAIVLGTDTLPTTLGYAALLVAAFAPALVHLRRRTA